LDLKTILNAIGFTFSNGIYRSKYKGKMKKIFVLRASGSKKEVIRVIKWMYSHKGDFYLRRKYEKVQNQIY